ncbi:MAG TPA: hypothetical protein VGQ71_11235, partial [Terriglobales bacterium]|nr:hypothetical protein [Terriglobales bacterium]
MFLLRKNNAQVARVSEILVAAGWFGAFTGLVEGASLLALDRAGWLTWPMAQIGASAELLYISPIVNTLLLVAVALAAVAISRAFGRASVLQTAVLLFTFWMLVDWLVLLGRLRHRSLLLLAAGLATVFLRWFRQHEAQALRFWRRTLPWLAAAAVLAL